MTLPRLWLFLAVALPALAAVIANLPSVDLTYHLRAGAQILDGGGIPTVDTWTFTVPGTPWTDQQWGAQVILTVVYRLAGWTGLVVFRSALIAVIFGSLLVICLRRGVGPRRSAWLVLAAFIVSAVALALRPQLIGMAIFAVILVLVTDRRAHPGRLWIIPVLMVLWATVHGSFFLGPVVLGLAWLEDVHDHIPGASRSLLVALVSVLAACITPFGPAVWLYAIGLTTNADVTARITEWQPTTIRTIPGIAFFGSALIVVALMARRGERTPWPTLAWLAVFFLVGVYALRGVAWWPLGAVAAIAGVLVTGPIVDPAKPAPLGSPTMRRLNAVVAVAIVLVGIALLPVWRPTDPGLGAPQGVVGNAPPGITAALRENAGPSDRLFNPQPWGSWFEFALPALPVAIDSRIELFPSSTWDTFENITSGGESWQSQLEAWGASMVVVAHRDAAFAGRLGAAGWRSIYADDDGSILVAPSR